MTRSEDVVRDRLRELHGTYLEKELGGMEPLAEAEALLWVLGHDDPSAYEGAFPRRVDVSGYMDVGDDSETGDP